MTNNYALQRKSKGSDIMDPVLCAKHLKEHKERFPIVDEVCDIVKVSAPCEECFTANLP